MDALSERVEVLVAVGVADDDLAVQHIATCGKLELGEVAPERLAVARLQEYLLAVDERNAAKAVELDLVAVVLALGQLLARERQLRLERRLQRQAHCLVSSLPACPPSACPASPSACPASPPAFALLGCTRLGSPFCLRKCGGQGASPSPSRSSRAASSSSPSRRPACSSMLAEGSPRSRSRAGTVVSVSSAGSTSATSFHSSGQDTRASGTARTE